MAKKSAMIFIPVVLIILSFFSYYFLFNIYEVKIKKEPDVIFADPTSQIKIIIQPVNFMGSEISFRSVAGKFNIIEGVNLVDTISKDEENGFLVLKSKGIPGMIEIIVDSKYSLLPSLIKIYILPKTA